MGFHQQRPGVILLSSSAALEISVGLLLARLFGGKCGSEFVEIRLSGNDETKSYGRG
jgi:hypothetical protein